MGNWSHELFAIGQLAIQQFVKQFPAFWRIRWFMTLYTKVTTWLCPQTKSVHNVTHFLQYGTAGLGWPSVFRSLLHQLRAYAILLGWIVPVIFGKDERPHTEELQAWKVLTNMLVRGVKSLISVRKILIRISAATPSWLRSCVVFLMASSSTEWESPLPYTFFVTRYAW